MECLCFCRGGSLYLEVRILPTYRIKRRNSAPAELGRVVSPWVLEVSTGRLEARAGSYSNLLNSQELGLPPSANVVVVEL